MLDFKCSNFCATSFSSASLYCSPLCKLLHDTILRIPYRVDLRYGVIYCRYVRYPVRDTVVSNQANRSRVQLTFEVASTLLVLFVLKLRNLLVCKNNVFRIPVN